MCIETLKWVNHYFAVTKENWLSLAGIAMEIATFKKSRIKEKVSIHPTLNKTLDITLLIFYELTKNEAGPWLTPWGQGR